MFAKNVEHKCKIEQKSNTIQDIVDTPNQTCMQNLVRSVSDHAPKIGTKNCYIIALFPPILSLVRQYKIAQIRGRVGES